MENSSDGGGLKTKQMMSKIEELRDELRALQMRSLRNKINKVERVRMRLVKEEIASLEKERLNNSK